MEMVALGAAALALLIAFVALSRAGAWKGRVDELERELRRRTDGNSQSQQ